MEIRPGNFIFYDLVQASLGACREEEIAAVVVCPVIATHPERGEIVVYGGGVHISKESLRAGSGEAVFGAVGRVAGADGAWTMPVAGAFVSSLSQEHGKIKAPQGFVSSVGIGESLAVFPVHACLTANLHGRYYVRGEGWIANIHSGGL
jgi:D-serine deaminase-like pyridoxal phosphate-dependent protein